MNGCPVFLCNEKKVENLVVMVHGRVYQGHVHMFGKLKAVIVKTVTGQYSASDLVTEACTLRHIAGADRVHNGGCIQMLHDSPKYLVLEKCGDSLSTFLQPNSDMLLVILSKLLDAVCALHALNIMHGDIKPSNILVEIAYGAIQVNIDFDRSFISCSKSIIYLL
jgi:serine/threonine protein kinase